MFEGQSHPDVTAIGSKGLSAKILLSQSESLFWNGRENRKKKTTFSEGLTRLHRNLCNPLRLPTKKNPQSVYRSLPPVYVFFISPIYVSISWHHHALLSMLIRVCRLNCVCRNYTLLLTANKYPCCHIPRAYICQHLCATMALALPPPAFNSQRGQ